MYYTCIHIELLIFYLTCFMERSRTTNIVPNFASSDYTIQINYRNLVKFWSQSPMQLFHRA